MRLLASGLLLAALGLAAAPPAAYFHVLDEDAGSWPEILGSVGLAPLGPPGAGAAVYVLRSEAAGDWEARVEAGAVVILEGASALAERFGFRATPRRVLVRSIRDARRPDLRIVWERPLELPVFELPHGAQLLAWERWERAPLMAALRRGSGAVLWLACSPGVKPYERFPYIPHALADLGVDPPLRCRRLWAFFDSSYRLRVDLEYFAERWRAAGFSALHVAAWRYFEPEAERDAYLRRLIESCHRRGLLVYAWLELPHVSERFWQEHPEWREKTALLQDAHLDWRRLMNLANRDCFRAAAAGVRELLERFDWDGVNLAELYFESLEGAANPARFTPMNPEVRREFLERKGFDPLELFQADSPRHLARNPAGLAAFLDYRAELAGRIQREWMGEIEKLRARRPHLDLVLTHVDDRFEPRMREAIGADAAGLLPLLEERRFTFLIEDPATVWHLGPQRYPEIARRYQALTPHAERLGIDINIVERYQNVYPTKQQTGTELFQLVRLASAAFPRVALYFESSILPPDWALLPAAAAHARLTARGARLAVESPRGVGVRWRGPVLVNGRPWPARDDEQVWLPAGVHVLEPGGPDPPLRLLDFNGELASAAALPAGLELAYRSQSRAAAVLDRPPARVEIDGQPVQLRPLESGGRYTLLLPRGQHLVAVEVGTRAALLH